MTPIILDDQEPPSQGKVVGQLRAYIKKSLSRLDIFATQVKNFSKKWIFENRKLLLKFGFLLVLTMIPWISEAAVNDQLYTDLKKYSGSIDPVMAGEFSQEVSQYLPGIEPKKEDVALSLMLKDDSYTLTQQLSLNTGLNIQEPARQESTYTVKQGETITQIAERFGLHVASILEKNDIKPEDLKKVKAGTVLNIPTSDTSTSGDWLAAVTKAEDDERKAAAAAEQKRLNDLKKKKLASSAFAASKATSKQTSSSGYDSVDAGDLILQPLASTKGISRGFGGGHTGVDYRCDVGTPVFAAGSGKVVVTSSGWSGGYGNQIVVDHGGGRATRYGHLSSINVSSGENVSRGQLIGYSGNTGRSTGPHLHFEVIINGRPVYFGI